MIETGTETEEFKASLANPPVVEGKTKRIYENVRDPKKVYLIAKCDITAGDGARHSIIPGKSKFATQTTCNVFRLLKASGIPVAFDSQVGTFTPSADDVKFYGYGFEATRCNMLQYEVVVRREAHGSYRDRHPHLPKGHIFPRLISEFFLKTKNKKWKSVKDGRMIDLLKDDPLMEFSPDGSQIKLFYPGHTSEERTNCHPGALVGQKPFLTLPEEDVCKRIDEMSVIRRMDTIARQSFLILERAWQILGKKIVDFKVEFGIGPNGDLYLADVIDNDSWRLVDSDGGYICKQFYRDGGDLNEVARKYRHVSELSDWFHIPHQRVIFWGSTQTKGLSPFMDSFEHLRPTPAFSTYPIRCSVSKQPELAYRMLQELASTIPNAVIIAFGDTGREASAMLRANAPIPVITVPADSPQEAADAMTNALKILALSNPAIYAALRMEQENSTMYT